MWRRHVLPLFTLVGATLLIAFVIVRAGQRGPAGEDFTPARNGLLAATADAPFDPALAVLSPIELTLAPESPLFLDSPFPADIEAEPDAILAVADGRVIHAGSESDGYTVILLHRRDDKVLETVYTGMASARVSVGAMVRRGQAIGNVPVDERGTFHFALRDGPGLSTAPLPGEKTEIPADWKGGGDDRLHPPPVGAKLAPSIQVEAPAAAP